MEEYFFKIVQFAPMVVLVLLALHEWHHEAALWEKAIKIILVTRQESVVFRDDMKQDMVDFKDMLRNHEQKIHDKIVATAKAKGWVKESPKKEEL